jgi:hypothetical protein
VIARSFSLAANHAPTKGATRERINGWPRACTQLGRPGLAHQIRSGGDMVWFLGWTRSSAEIQDKVPYRLAVLWIIPLQANRSRQCIAKPLPSKEEEEIVPAHPLRHKGHAEVLERRSHEPKGASEDETEAKTCRPCH